MNKTLVIGIVVVVVGIFAVGGFLLWMMQSSPVPAQPNNEQTQSSSSGTGGLSPEEAGRVVPLKSKINLKAETTSEGVLLKWDTSDSGVLVYYDIHEREPGTIGWGELVKRVAAQQDQSSYSYVVTGRVSGQTYEYQIIGINVSGGYEIKETASKSIEVV